MCKVAIGIHQPIYMNQNNLKLTKNVGGVDLIRKVDHLTLTTEKMKGRSTKILELIANKWCLHSYQNIISF